MNVKVSIIMPVYNGEKYLRKTMDAVLAQSFRDFELIAVNDGSTDDSGLILNEYAEKIKFMTILEQKNSGVSTARNRGIEIAKGKYVCFIDSDDLIHSDFLKLLYEMTETHNADITFCKYQTFYDSQKVDLRTMERHSNALPIQGKNQIEIFEKVMEMGYGTSPCIKLYKTEILKKYLIQFDNKLTYGEDMFFNWKVFLVASKVYYLPIPLYYYRQPRESATSRYHADLYENYIREYNSVRKFANNISIDTNCLEKAIKCNLVERIPSFLRMIIRQPGNLIFKYKCLKKLVDKEELQGALQIYFDRYNHKKGKDFLFTSFSKKRYSYIFISCYEQEFHVKLSRFIKNCGIGV